MRPEKELYSSQAPGSALPQDGFVWDGVLPSPGEPASGAAKLTAAPQALVQEGMDGAARQAPRGGGGGRCQWEPRPRGQPLEAALRDASAQK